MAFKTKRFMKSKQLIIGALILGLGLLGLTSFYSRSEVHSGKDPVCEIYGKIKIVEYGEDYKVKIVEYGEDLEIKWVDYGEQEEGRWKEVDYGEDYKIKWVDYGEDFSIEEVEYGEGC